MLQDSKYFAEILIVLSLLYIILKYKISTVLTCFNIMCLTFVLIVKNKILKLFKFIII